jgi:hypothetical protein
MGRVINDSGLELALGVVHGAKPASVVVGNPFTARLVSDYCNNVAQAVLDGLPAYGYQRQSSIARLRDAVIGEVINHGLGHLVPPGTVTAAEFASTFVEAQINRTAVGVLAWMWNGAGCATQQVTANVVRQGGGSNSSGQWHWVCVWEDWEISFDGGAHWHPIDVWVCSQQPGQI